MSSLWSEIVHKLTVFFLKLLDEHPGKLIGSILGFLLGLFVVLLGFWKTFVLFLFVIIGFLLGKRQDDNKKLFDWLDRFFN
ncbi:DUF2273 domain-containing protein [Desulfitobacterium metallireducens]|uniref:Membrane protein n=1 Tax=Desulfitobacterium metallireducens DSM 15288 TaxID=871968 RepID=W0EDX0_9FIRM|nr:DUF2273 domain-containing protein [Desulfitobacterium metallireducens]AHF07399.1 membrane protein [Desulfitobacterium metallireducens DSM 15288]